jgi:hypothetical protein
MIIGKTPPETAELPDWLTTAISPERFRPYMARTMSLDEALELYGKNLEMTGDLIRWVGFAEVAIRNAVCQQLSVRFGEVGNIFDSLEPFLTKEGKATLKSARTSLIKAGRKPSAGRLVTELPFGFWKYLFTATYETTLWTPSLRHAFPNIPIQSRALALDSVQHIAELRNRLAHNEPIFMRNLTYDMNVIRSTLHWISAEAKNWANDNIPALKQ